MQRVSRGNCIQLTNSQIWVITVPEQHSQIWSKFLFFCSFFFDLVAFLFNWIGFLLLMCACHTVAGRYGALAGFGLSLAKWTLIVKHSTDLASNDNNWLWWLIMAFGKYAQMKSIEIDPTSHPSALQFNRLPSELNEFFKKLTNLDSNSLNFLFIVQEC